MLDGDLRADVQMLHFAATTRAGVQAEVRATGFDTLRRFTVNLHHHGFFKRRLFAVDIGGDQLIWQRTFNEDHLAIGSVGYALGFDVERFDGEQVGQVVFKDCGQVAGGRHGHRPIVSG